MATSESSSSAEGNTNELPDLYRLLALEPLEKDPRKIEQALELVRKKAMTAKDTDPKLAQRAAKIVALGQKHLLDGQRKTAYDLAWKTSYGTVSGPAAPEASKGRRAEAMATTTGTAVTDLMWDMSELENYLPAEDPRAAFDLAGFLQFSESLPESNPAADYDRLQGFLGGATASVATLAAPESVSALALLPELSQPSGKSQPTSKGALRSQPASASALVMRGTSSVANKKNSGSLAQQMRKKRSQSFLLSVIGMLLGVGMILGVTLYLIRNNNGQSEGGQLAMAEQVIAPKPNVPSPVAPTVPRGSGLPRVSGLDNPGTGTPTVVADSPMNGNKGTDSVPQAPTNGPEPMPTPTVVIPAPMVTPEPMPSAPWEPQPATPMPEPPADSTLSDEEKSQWQQSMKGVRELLGSQEFDKARERLTDCEKTAKTVTQRQQHQRLATVARLAAEFHQALVSAVTGMGAGENFTIGKSTSALFVEGSVTEVVVRLKDNPKNVSYKLIDLPIGLAYGLADLRMDTAHQSALARKAAFALVHAKSNALAIKVAREMMAQAAAAGVVEADLPEVFDDDYSLASP